MGTGQQPTRLESIHSRWPIVGKGSSLARKNARRGQGEWEATAAHVCDGVVSEMDARTGVLVSRNLEAGDRQQCWRASQKGVVTRHQRFAVSDGRRCWAPTGLWAQIRDRAPIKSPRFPLGPPQPRHSKFCGRDESSGGRGGQTWAVWCWFGTAVIGFSSSKTPSSQSSHPRDRTTQRAILPRPPTHQPIDKLPCRAGHREPLTILNAVAPHRTAPRGRLTPSVAGPVPAPVRPRRHGEPRVLR
jgi:hypothetical protein